MRGPVGTVSVARFAFTLGTNDGRTFALAAFCNPASTAAKRFRSPASIAAQCSHACTCSCSAWDSAAPLAAASVKPFLYLSHSIATSPLISCGPQTAAISPCRSASPALPQPLPGCALPSPRAAAPVAAFPAVRPSHDRSALEIRSTPRVLPHLAVQLVWLVAPIPFRATPAALPNVRDPAPTGRQCARAIREIAAYPASGQTAGKLAAALPAQHLPHPDRCARRSVPRETQVGRTPRAAPQIPGAGPPAPLPGSNRSQRRELAGSEPAPAFVLTCEPTALALPVHILDVAIPSAVRLLRTFMRVRRSKREPRHRAQFTNETGPPY